MSHESATTKGGADQSPKAAGRHRQVGVEIDGRIAAGESGQHRALAVLKFIPQ
jgi:hypothetical protein